jgi:hypothetical protein
VNEAIQAAVCRATGARAVASSVVLQELWSGYGEIVRCVLVGSELPSVVVKHVRLGGAAKHPRGWNTDLGHQRKLRSYQVETAWYQNWAERCDSGCRVPHCLGSETIDGDVVLVLEDLDAAGFPARRQRVNANEIAQCLGWLAHFHATFMDTDGAGLWPQGTYWHLATRSEELARLDDEPLRAAAAAIDQCLEHSAYLTLVHGDAKLANFCFAADGGAVAAVDFQYVGRGCGMKDVAYFISSCLNERDCERQQNALLDSYFAALRTALSAGNPAIDAAKLENDWRALYPVAWADFYRFLKGWSPGHWKMHKYSEHLTRQVVAEVMHA